MLPETPVNVAVIVAVPLLLPLAKPPPPCPLLIAEMLADHELQCADAVTSWVVPLLKQAVAEKCCV